LRALETTIDNGTRRVIMRFIGQIILSPKQYREDNEKQSDPQCAVTTEKRNPSFLGEKPRSVRTITAI
jgi:hypothetical protein